MEIALLILVTANLAATIWFGKQLLSREDYRVEFIQIPGEIYSLSLEDEPQPEQKESPQPEVVEEKKVAAQPSYSAWENKKNIPWNGTQRTPEPPAPRPEGYGYVK